MAELDLTGEIAEAIDGALEHGASVVLGYVTADGKPSLSFRGSTLVYSADQLAVWARNPAEGLAQSVIDRPDVALAYFSPATPGPAFLSIKGRARVAPEANEVVYGKIPAIEQTRDPERKGVAILIDVYDVVGRGAEGLIHQERA
jgi:hypothetical protein